MQCATAVWRGRGEARPVVRLAACCSDRRCSLLRLSVLLILYIGTLNSAYRYPLLRFSAPLSRAPPANRCPICTPRIPSSRTLSSGDPACGAPTLIPLGPTLCGGAQLRRALEPARPSLLSRAPRRAAAGRPPTSAPGRGSPLPHLRRDWAHPRHICAGTGLARPHLHWEPAQLCAACAPGLGSRPATSAPGLGSPPATSALGLGPPRPTSALGAGPALRRMCAGTGLAVVVVVAMQVARPSPSMARGVGHSLGSFAGRQAQAEAYTRTSSAVDFGASTIVLPKLYKWHVRAAAVFSQLAARTHGPSKSVAARSRLRIIVLRVRISG